MPAVRAVVFDLDVLIPEAHVMFKNLTLVRPLVVLDLETTGVDTKSDRIVELSVLKVWPDGTRRHHTRRLNPGIPIPLTATAIHGITDADVAGAKRFEEIVDKLLTYLDGCDLCGFNFKRFDLQVLHHEVLRAGRKLHLEGRAVVDTLEIFHAKERRDLSAAVRFYCGREHDGAHQAEADVLATAEVLDAMLARHDDLPRNVAGLHEHLKDPAAVDMDNFFTRAPEGLRFSKGKHRGQPLDAIAQTAPDYLEWMLEENFFEDTKALVREALRRAGRRAADAVVV
jgi:DNA polymerase III subunit epsilon